jgi:phospholipid/cholesterol/gamma-HCH transport system ATP-binding protein
MEAPVAHKEILKSSNRTNAIEVRGLYKSFGSNHVLVDFNMELEKGRSMAVLGKSGSGKSVLIKCIIGLLQPDKGEIEVLGKSVPDLDDEEMDRLRVKVGFLFQSNALYDSMTVRENLEFPLRRHWIREKQENMEELVLHALEDVGLAHAIDMMPAELSGGMRKRIALARTLIMKPEIILYDEPTTGLDPITAREICELMVSIHRKYKNSSLIISHDMNCIRMTADKIIVLMEGQAYREGTFDELAHDNDSRIKQFFI